ncbi:MAG: AAA family ATPase [Gammaproteobacteria bacterium]|nr:AAA family ATPase [Gammaproteobacteria bacterium]
MKISWAELRRRKVVRVLIAYVIGAWVLMQIGDTVFGLLEVPAWAGKALVATLVLGLPLAVILSWIFDITPEGVVATDAADPPPTGRFEFSELGSIHIEQLDLGRPQLTPLVGRQEERAAIEKKLDEAANGTGGIVLLGGEPGVGKTRLAEEALEMGLQRGMLPLVGHAYEEHGAPFITSTEILEDVMRALPPEILKSALADTAPEISRLLPDLRRLFPDIPEPLELPPEQQQRYLFNALLEFTRRLSESCPLVMLLDDLQWADESSVLLLEHLVAQISRMRLLIVITYRDISADQGEPFKRALAQFSRHDFVTRIPLRQLSRDDVGALLGNLGGSPAPDAVIDIIHQETEGNAFFVKSVYQHLAEEGRLFDAKRRWLTDIDTEQLAVPEGVRLVIERRLQRLSEPTGKILILAAVAGLRFDLGVLETALGESSDDALEAIEEAETAGLVFAASGQRDARYEFAHALVRHTLLDDLSTARQQRVHLQIATAMEHSFGDGSKGAADIAQHLYRAGTAAQPDKTRRYLELAGQQALAAAAADEAADAFGKALELDITGEQRANLLNQRGVAYRTLGRWEEAGKDWLEALPIFEQLGAGQQVSQICWDLAYKYAWDNEMAKAEALAHRGLTAVGDEPSVARCQLLAAFGMCAGERKDFHLWEKHVEEAIAMAGQLGEERLLGGDILMGKQYMGEHWLKGGLHAETADQSIALVRRVGTPWDLSNALSAAFLGYLNNGRFDDVESNYQETIDLARKYGNFGAEMHAKITYGQVQCYRGELEEGRDRIKDRADWSRSVDFAWKTVIIGMQGLAEFWTGHWDRARQIAEEISAEPIEGTMAGWEAAFKMLLLAYEGDPEVDDLIEELKPRICVAGQENQLGSWCAGMALLETTAVLGRREQCASLHACAVQLDQAGTHVVVNLGLARKFAGIAAAAGGDWALAEKHFDTAEEKAEKMGNVLELAELLRWRAQMLLWRDEAGDRERARETLTQAHSAYREIGMTRHVGIADDLLDTLEPDIPV